MPVATLDDGVQFFYEDSGAGQGSYLTIVCVHGSAFTAGECSPTGDALVELNAIQESSVR